jgi:hypothetical protein
MMSEPDMRLEHARWLLDRSDRLRSSYASRAALVLGIDTGILGALFAVLGLAGLHFTSLAGVLLLLVLAFTSASIVYAFLASSSLNIKSRKLTKEDSDKRLFLSPTNSFGEGVPNFARFKESFENSDVDAFVTHALSELFVALALQDRRYHFLKRSIYGLFGALGILVGLFLILLIR